MNWDWLAGFIDGEGCIRAKKIYQASAAHPEGYYLMPQLHIGNTHEATIRAIRDFVGIGSVARKERKRESHKALFEYVLHAAGFRSVAFDLIPRLVTKRPQAVLAYYMTTMRGAAARRERNTGRKGRSPTLAPTTNLESFLDECLRVLNHKGKGADDRLRRVEAAHGMTYADVYRDATTAFNLGQRPEEDDSESLAVSLGLV